LDEHQNERPRLERSASCSETDDRVASDAGSNDRIPLECVLEVRDLLYAGLSQLAEGADRALALRAEDHAASPESTHSGNRPRFRNPRWKAVNLERLIVSALEFLLQDRQCPLEKRPCPVDDGIGSIHDGNSPRRRARERRPLPPGKAGPAL